MITFGIHAETTPAGQAMLSLDGPWKFATIKGDGPNYIDIQQEPADIIVDNSDIGQVQVEGNWRRFTTNKNGAPFHGKGFLGTWFSHDYPAYVRFLSEIPKPGSYGHFVRFSFASHLNAKVNVQHAGGESSFFFNLRTRYGEWLSLGVFEAPQPGCNHLDVTSDAAGGVVADAVMLRPVSEDKAHAAIDPRRMVFLPAFDDTTWNDLPVPSHWRMINGSSNYSGKGWYRKTFELPPDRKGVPDKRIRDNWSQTIHPANSRP